MMSSVLPRLAAGSLKGTSMVIRRRGISSLSPLSSRASSLLGNSTNNKTIAGPSQYPTHQSWSVSPYTPIRQPSTRYQSSAALTNDEEIEEQTNSSSDEDESKTLFSQLSNLHEHSFRALSTQSPPLTTMTEIQSKSFEAASAGMDVFGRARTGTGKTLAFLLPTIETLCKNRTDTGSYGTAVILSPTRELTIQIASQAEMLTKYHPGMTVQTLYGGTSKYLDVQKFGKHQKSNGRDGGGMLPNVLVCTPGRLLDHLNNTNLRYGRNNISFSDAMKESGRVLVLDEMDRLLDMGFRTDVMDIVSHLPYRDNTTSDGEEEQRAWDQKQHSLQTLLFSATLQEDLKPILEEVMKSDYVTVDCIKDEDPHTHTATNVLQSHLILPSSNDRIVSSVMEVLFKAMEEGQEQEGRRGTHKILAFFPTARLVAFYADIFNRIIKVPNVIEIHSRKTQKYRTKASERFRKMKRGIMFTSDVSARGVDYPDVTHVVQFGLPDSRETYIHRLGRTARAGKQGKGWLVLSPFEKAFLKELHGVDIPENDELQQIMSDPPTEYITNLLNPVRAQISSKGDKSTNNDRDQEDELLSNAKTAYTAMIGYYKSQMKRMGKGVNKEKVVAFANNFALQTGFTQPPRLSQNIVNKMGLNGVKGLMVNDRNQGRRMSPRGDAGRGGSSRRTGNLYDDFSGRGGGGGGGGRGGEGRRGRNDAGGRRSRSPDRRQDFFEDENGMTDGRKFQNRDERLWDSFDDVNKW